MKIRCPRCKRVSEIAHVDHGRNVVCSCRNVFQIDESTVIEEYSLPDQKPPETIGRYPIKRFIGRGGSGCVYEGVHPELGIPVAVKTLLPDFAGNKAARNLFYQASRIYAKAVHPNIVKVYEAGKDASGVPFLVMEYLPGETLGDKLIEHKKFTPREAAEIGAAVCRALTATAKLGIVHRDVKPDNIMISADGQYKLTDLGLAKLDTASLPGNGARVLDEDFQVQGLPMTGFGTLEYMSPEQYLYSEDCDVRSDIYSLGVTLYHLAAGRLPFETVARTELRRMHLSVEPLVPSAYVPGIPIDFDYIVLRCLQKSPEDRYQTPGELLADLEAFLADSPLPSTTCGAEPANLPQPFGSAQTSARRNRPGFPVMAAIVLLLMILILGLMLAFLKRHKPQERPAPAQIPEAASVFDSAPQDDSSRRIREATAKSMQDGDVLIVDQDYYEREHKLFDGVMADADRALSDGSGYRHAIEDLENYLANPLFSEAAEAKIERLKTSSEAAVARLLAPLDRAAGEHRAKGDFKAAENVYLTADLGDLEPEAREIVKSRIEAIRAEAATSKASAP
ncbi:MAG: protein kinase [Lentisphaeria bacterium]|nr:protein kinase [Lentisphaeria bacterium]